MKLSLLYVNDVHGYVEAHPELFYNAAGVYTQTVGGYARVAGLANKVKADNEHVLLFDGGDTFHGTKPLIDTKGEALVPILNRIGFSAMVAHWDFAYGPAQLQKLSGMLQHPILGINVYKQNGELFLPPYTLINLPDLCVAVIGICCNIVDKTMPSHFSEGLTFTDGGKELPRYIDEVKQRGANLVILLSHNGFPQDVALLEKVDGVDVCLSAHTHNRLYKPFTAGRTPVVQCGCHGAFAGHVQLEVDDGRVKRLEYELIKLDDSIPQDEWVREMAMQLMQPYRELQNNVAGNTGDILHRYESLSSAMDDFLLAALCDATGCSIAFSNGWRYGASIPAGPITLWDLYNMVPMNPVITTVELTGQEIINMLEENLEHTYSGNAMRQMGGYVKRCAGLQVYIKVENPQGARLQQVFTQAGMLEPNAVYKAAFITAQGVPPKFGTNRVNTSIHVVDALKAYLTKYPVINFGSGLHSVHAV